MNGIVKIVVIALVMFGAYSAFNSKSPEADLVEVDTSNWVSYNFSSENVSVKFPIEPKVSNVSNQDIAMEFAQAKNAVGSFSVGVMRVNAISEDDFYPFSLTKKGAKVNSSSPINVSGYTGKKYTLSFGEKKVYQRFINYKGLLLTQTSIVSHDNESVVKGFNDSLEL